MSSIFKNNQFVFLFSFYIIIGISITSCDNKAEQELMALKALVPAESKDQLAYITKAIKWSNELQIAKTSPDRVGHPISQNLSDQITLVENICLDSTQAVFFSLVNIFETLDSIGLDSLGSDSGIAVVFGKYPSRQEPGQPSNIFGNELSIKGLDPVEYYNKPTVVLKYVKKLNPTGAGTEYFTRGNNTTGKATGADEQYITNMGMGCPQICPPGTN
jgi:hypothetical protein